MTDQDGKHHPWMSQALALAERALPGDVPVGAVILGPDGTVVGEGWNTKEQEHVVTGHAELMAMKAAGNALGTWRLTGCTLYVTLEPCPMCASALLQARIDTIVYGADDPVQGALGSALNLVPLYHYPVTVLGGIQQAACRQQLQDFFQTVRQREPGQAR